MENRLFDQQFVNLLFASKLPLIIENIKLLKVAFLGLFKFNYYQLSSVGVY